MLKLNCPLLFTLRFDSVTSVISVRFGFYLFLEVPKPKLIMLNEFLPL